MILIFTSSAKVIAWSYTTRVNDIRAKSLEVTRAHGNCRCVGSDMTSRGTLPSGRRGTDAGMLKYTVMNRRN